LEQLLAEGSEIAVIGYHINDNYTNIYSDARAEYYGMVGLPHVVIDGTQSFEWTYDSLLAKYEERISIASNYSVTIDADRDGTTVNATINVGQIGAPNPETKVLHLILIESHIPESWYGGEEVNHVERLMIPDQNGTPFISGKSVKSTFEFEFEMDPSWLVQHCELIAFLQDTITKEVMQAQTFSLESTVLYNDVALTDIINPGDDYCNETIAPIVEIENYGADTLVNCIISYDVNGEENEFFWEGILSTYQSEQVVLPEISFILEDENIIFVGLSQPNGQPDENPNNNSTEKSFSMSQTISYQNLILELKTDIYGYETSWQLLDGSGEVINSGSGYQDTTYYVIDLELPAEDCYTFIIYDDGGNGICCESGFGYYRIKDINGLVYFIGGNFDDQEISTFQIDIETGYNDIGSKDKIVIYPNPASYMIFIESPLEIRNVAIYNHHGQLIFEESVNLKLYQCNISGFLSGLYYFMIETEKGTYTRRIFN